MDVFALAELGRRTLPGLAAGAALLAWVPRSAAWLRVFVYVGLFVLVRDAMTPVGLWTLTPLGVLRFMPDAGALAVLAAASLGLVGLSWALDPALRPHLVWWHGPRWQALGLGALGAGLVAAPVLGIHAFLGLPADPPPMAAWPAIAALALLGTLLEEVLFRGYLQGLLAEQLAPARAALASALLFAFCHGPLVGAVADHGFPIALFTFYEGLVAATLRWRHGLVAAALAHGGAILILALA